MKDIKKDYICAVPFSSIEYHDRHRFLCCASWLKKYLPEESSPLEAWNSKEAFDIRESILDGSYRYCDSKHCPALRQLTLVGPVGRIHPLYPKSDLPPSLKKKINAHKNNNLRPSIVQFSFDRTCNLKCPSCRIEVFTANKEKIGKVESMIQLIKSELSSHIEVIYITGSGDPFTSVGFKKFLRTFSKSDWPVLKNIHLHTNATLWDKKMWNTMKNVHPFVKSCEISIDAATKDTYENKVRLGGNWEQLLKNLKFISSIPSIHTVKTSFVVQQKNFGEMKLFYDLMVDIFKFKASVYYGKITNWGTFTKEQFIEEEVWNPEHPQHLEFIEEVNKVLPAKQAWSNLQEFIYIKTKVI